MGGGGGYRGVGDVVVVGALSARGGPVCCQARPASQPDAPLAAPPAPAQMEVGIEDCLHIEFEYDRARYHLKDCVVGKIYFLLVRRASAGCRCAACLRCACCMCVAGEGLLPPIQGLRHRREIPPACAPRCCV